LRQITVLGNVNQEVAMSDRLKIAINTGGGDAPGLNAVIYAVTMAAERHGWEVYGIHTGYKGLFNTDEITRLTPEKVAGIVSLGGTILGTTNKGDPFNMPVKNAVGDVEIRDVSGKIVSNFKRLGLDVLIAVGGDGSLRLANRLAGMGMPVVGVPKTIDNDLASTVITFGFDTAVTTSTEAIDKLHSTASAHQRVMVVEVMGRYAGWIALNSGISGSADAILIPEIPFKIDSVCNKIMNNELHDKDYGIVVVAEGAKAEGGDLVVKGAGEEGRQEVLLGGIGEWVAREIHQRTGKDTRSLVLGHLQRGGSPTTFDRLVALRFGAAAVRFIAEGQRNVMVALRPPDMVAVPLAEAVEKMKAVPLNSDTILTARDLGISFGDD
jgi:ATP-dependent phosphofructokinase / diphosphate-dependent phosphofructokinase